MFCGQSQSASIDIPRKDGDVVRVSVRATDVMGSAKVDSVILNVDSSPPVVATVSLTIGDVDGLHVQNSVEFYRMK